MKALKKKKNLFFYALSDMFLTFLVINTCYGVRVLILGCLFKLFWLKSFSYLYGGTVTASSLFSLSHHSKADLFYCFVALDFHQMKPKFAWFWPLHVIQTGHLQCS